MKLLETKKGSLGRTTSTKLLLLNKKPSNSIQNSQAGRHGFDPGRPLQTQQNQRVSNLSANILARNPKSAQNVPVASNLRSASALFATARGKSHTQYTSSSRHAARLFNHSLVSEMICAVRLVTREITCFWHGSCARTKRKRHTKRKRTGKESALDGAIAPGLF